MPALFLGQESVGAVQHALERLLSFALQEAGIHRTHKYTAFPGEFGDASATIRKRATRHTRKWCQIPRTGKNSLRTVRVNKKYRNPN